MNETNNRLSGFFGAGGLQTFGKGALAAAAVAGVMGLSPQQAEAQVPVVDSAIQSQLVTPDTLRSDNVTGRNFHMIALLPTEGQRAQILQDNHSMVAAQFQNQTDKPITEVMISFAQENGLGSRSMAGILYAIDASPNANALREMQGQFASDDRQRSPTDLTLGAFENIQAYQRGLYRPAYHGEGQGPTASETNHNTMVHLFQHFQIERDQETRTAMFMNRDGGPVASQMQAEQHHQSAITLVTRSDRLYSAEQLVQLHSTFQVADHRAEQLQNAPESRTMAQMIAERFTNNKEQPTGGVMVQNRRDDQR